MTVEAAELQKFKLGANAFLLAVDGKQSNLYHSVFKYFIILLTFCLSFTKFFIFVVFIFFL